MELLKTLKDDLSLLARTTYTIEDHIESIDSEVGKYIRELNKEKLELRKEITEMEGKLNLLKEAIEEIAEDREDCYKIIYNGKIYKITIEPEGGPHG